MARQGKSRHKVVSSGRLTGCGRGQVNKKTVVGRHAAPLEPAYSLYSTDSEDQVTTIHKGLDRCAALLSGILHSEKTDTTESKSKSQVPKTVSSKLKSKGIHGKVDTEKKRLGKKSSSVSHITKKPAVVQKTILSSQTYPGLRQQPIAVDVVHGLEVKPTAQTPATQSEHIQPHSLPLLCPVSGGSNSLPSTGLQPSTVFNCRLTTSTPVLSPQRPTSAHSQASHRETDGEMHYFTQQWDVATEGQSRQHGALNTAVPPTQYTALLSVAPAVQRHPVASTVSAVHQASIHPAAKGELRVPSPLLSAPHVLSVGQSAPLQSQNASQSCPSPTVAAHIPTQVPITSHPQTYPQPVLVHSSHQEQSSGAEESSEESGGCTSEEDELAGVDTTPVRDTSCQTSMKKHTVQSSPEKTARKVMTVKYLLGELKTLVANQDSEAVRLISEVEQSISLLPAMVGSTNVQAELALALQPLRSENVQLRRRLRILNQQLMERERAERQARSVDCNLELATLQSLNITLQTQLNDSHRELGNLQQENQRLQQALEDKENDLQQSKEQCELETSRVRLDVSEALAEMRNCKAKLEDSERENTALTQSLQQKEAEITRLQEIIRNLQKRPTREIACQLTQTEVPNPPSQLTKSVLDLYENQQKETAVTDPVSDSIKTYLQTLGDTGHSASPQKSHPQPHSFSPSSHCQWRGREESCRACETKAISPKRLAVPRPAQDTSAGGGTQEAVRSESGTAFVPLKETLKVHPAATLTQNCSRMQTNERNRVDEVNEHPGLKYLGLAFEKLGIVNGPPAQDLKTLDDNRGKDFLSHADGVGSQLKRSGEGTVNFAEQSQNARRCLKMGEASMCMGRPSVFENTVSSCDIKSLASDWSLNSWSTFNTRDEQDFRNGLAALDASIESLQKTLKADLKLK
ncbi:coiled-coil domain-containing protein 14 [Colossoma macropomum]|uniref:coiled-coil domain-containing protein 14 n=1 Tax=Colossoma macropomum TaxID=42526 RepID=UPI0018653951|nr:coiled-coil domain-containing protein 14 [Colossoma macropomum]